MADSKPDMLSTMPPWVRAVALVGFPIFMCLYFMAKDIGYLPSVPEANAKVIHEIANQHINQAKYLKAICHNTAREAADHRRCEE